MSFPRYRDYHLSGANWPRELPDAWEVRRFKNTFKLVTQKANESDRQIALENVESWTGRLIQTESEFANDGIAFLTGDLLLGKLRPYLAKVYLATSSGQAVGDFYVLRPSESVLASFAQYYMLTREFISLLDSSTIGAKMPRVNWEFLRELWIPLPEISNQALICGFLDRETAKIDSLIAEQERLIELLKEKRQAVISQAVTKGLNPDAPMKPSGVEWLGDVPEHWNTTRLVFLATKIGSGKTPLGGALVYESSGVIFIRSQNVYDDGIRLDDVSFISDEIDSEMSATRVLSWDVLLNITGASIGRCALVPKEFLAANVNQHVCILRFGDSCVARWVHACLCSNAAKEQIRSLQTGSGREGLNFSQVGAIRVTMPPDKEIESILNYLGKEMHRIDSALADMENSRILLRERRSALISAAVTGQIDVRGFAEQSAA